MESNNGSFYGKTKTNPFAEAFPDPLCKLNLKETSEFVKSFPMQNNLGAETNNVGFLEASSAQRRREGVNSLIQRRAFEAAPPTPGRPVFSFSSSGNFSRKSFPSKWDDAEKWLISSSCHDSPAHTAVKSSSESVKTAKQNDGFKPQLEVFSDKSRVTEEKSFHNNSVRGFNASTDHVFLKGEERKSNLHFWVDFCIFGFIFLQTFSLIASFKSFDKVRFLAFLLSCLIMFQLCWYKT